MRKSILTVLLVLAVIVVAGCGGGGEEATSPPAGEATGGATSGGGATPPAPIVTTSTAQNADEITKPVQFIADADTPSAFKKALKKKKPICVEFYLPSDPVTRDVAREIAPLKKTFGKQIIFFAYDVNKAEQTAAIGAQLKIGYEPYIVILDKNGYIVYRHSGYVDGGTLKQQLFSTLRR